MKRILFLTILLASALSFTSFTIENTSKKASIETFLAPPASCDFKGKKLFGKVQFVTAHPDVKIQYVDAYADIKVQMVKSGATSCGKWQEVSSGATLKVQIVNSFPDLKVKLVTSGPGMN